MEYNGSNGSPTESLNSKTMSTKQYFLVNLSKFIVEMVGTLTIGIFYMMIGDQQVGVLLGLWVIILFGESISGSHFNPAITLVFMLRKNSTHLGTRRLKGIFYIVAQMLGGILSGLFSKIFLAHQFEITPRFEPCTDEGFYINNVNTTEADNTITTITCNYLYSDAYNLTADEQLIKTEFAAAYPDYRGFSALTSEVLASCVFIFLFMLSTDKKTQYSEDKVINCFIMSASYVAARLMGGGGIVTILQTQVHLIPGEPTSELNPYVYHQSAQGPLLNPAVALGQMVFTFTFEYFVTYVLMPFAGSVLALIFYEYVFVKSQEYLNGPDSEEGSDGGLSMDSEQLGAGLAPAPEDKKDEKSKEIAPINKDDDDTIEADD